MTKEKITVTVDSDSIKWIDSQIKTKKYASRSHCIVYAIESLKQKSEN